MKTQLMLPPEDGGRNSVVVNGRNYSSKPGVSIHVPGFDAVALEANGWTILTAGDVIGGRADTWAARMRCWASSAQGNNPHERPLLRGAQAWRPAPNWVATAVYLVGNAVNANSQLWVCIGAGTSGSNAPTGSTLGAIILDGTVRWLWQPYFEGTYVSNAGSLFRVMTGGLPAISGTGPTGGPGPIIDGTTTLSYMGPQECPIVSYGFVHNPALSRQHTPTPVDSNSLVRWRGGIPVTRILNDIPQPPTVWTYSTDPSPSSGGIISNPANGIQRDAGWCGFEVRHDGIVCEISLLNNQTALSIIIDGQFIAGVTWTPTGAGSQQITIDFSNLARKSRVICVEGTAVGLVNLATEPTGSFQRPNRVDDSFMVAGICDSHGYGTGAMLPRSANFFHTLATLMGWPDDYCDALAGTGYIATNGGLFSNFQGRAISQLQRIVAYGKTIQAIVIDGSQNDSGQQNAAVTYAALGLYQSLRTAGFNQPIFVIGTPSNGGPSATHIANDNAVKSAVTIRVAEGDNLIWYVDISTMAQPVLFGTGRVGATNGSGNTDFYIGADGTHMSNAGALYVAVYIRDKINAILSGQA